MRPYTAADGPAVVELVVAAGMFSSAEAGFLVEGALEVGDGDARCLLGDVDEGRAMGGVLYYRPEDAADRAFDLTMIAVRPDLQGAGRGAALMGYAERDLRARGQRLMLVRTSSSRKYDRTRGFYRRLGYQEHTRVPDYWSDGDDMVLFTKHLLR